MQVIFPSVQFFYVIYYKRGYLDFLHILLMSVPSKMLWTPSDILLQNGVNADLDPLYHQLNLIIMVREDTHIKVFF